MRHRLYYSLFLDLFCGVSVTIKELLLAMIYLSKLQLSARACTLGRRLKVRD